MADSERHMADSESEKSVRTHEIIASPISCSTISDSESESNTASSELVDEIVTLQVDYQRFVTKLATLVSGSGFFAAMFSKRSQQEQDANKYDSCSYFVDADPKMFQHILRYLRRNRFPIFYGKNGHDHDMYEALLAEARYFQIDRLVNWLESQRYLDAVNILWEPITTTGIKEATRANVEIGYHPFSAMETEYVCPRGIPVHERPSQCGRACEKARDGAPPEYKSIWVTKMLVARKELVFDRTCCLE